MTGQQWHYMKGGAQQGPVTSEQVKGLIATGEIGRGDLVWTQGMPEWQPADSIPEFFGGAAYGQSAHMLGYQTPAGLGVQYVGFWLRFCAVFIDGLILQVIELPVDMMLRTTHWQQKTHPASPVAMVFSILFSVVVGWLYEALQTSSEHQATLGKRAVGIVVTDASGQRLSFAHATGRYFAKFLSSLTCGIGFLMAAFTERKQGLHDIVAGTLVVKKQKA